MSSQHLSNCVSVDNNNKLQCGKRFSFVGMDKYYLGSTEAVLFHQE